MHAESSGMIDAVKLFFLDVQDISRSMFYGWARRDSGSMALEKNEKPSGVEYLRSMHIYYQLCWKILKMVSGPAKLRFVGSSLLLHWGRFHPL